MFAQTVVQPMFNSFNVDFSIKQTSGKWNSKNRKSANDALKWLVSSLRIDSGPQRILEQRPHWLMIGWYYALNWIVGDALDRRTLRDWMTINIDIACSPESYCWQLEFVQDSVSVSRCALLRGCIELLRSDIVLVSWREIYFSFFEPFESCTVRKNWSQPKTI